MIILGYPGIGKTTLANTKRCMLPVVDLESSCFYDSYGKRPENWWEYYCKVGEYLSRQHYVVLMGMQSEVRDRLRGSKEEVYLIFPSLDLKKAWIDRLRKRFDANPSPSALLALNRAVEKFDRDILELMNDSLHKFVISSMDYNLGRVIDRVYFTGELNYEH